MNTLKASYEKILTANFSTLGYPRYATGLYALSNDGVIWRSLWINFHSQPRKLAVSPNLALFCPRASAIIDAFFAEGRSVVPIRVSKFGRPFAIRPLYDCIRSEGEARMPYSYDVIEAGDIDRSVRMIVADLKKCAIGFWGHIESIADLQNEIIKNSFGPATGINAIALAYLLDPDVSSERIKELSDLSPNAITSDFSARVISRVKKT